MKKQLLRKKVKEAFAEAEIIFQPKMRDLILGQTIVDIEGRIGRVTDFDPTRKKMFNSAQRWHSVCAKFDDSNYDDCLQWSDVYCLINIWK